MVHVGQQHLGQPRRGQYDAHKGQHIGVVQVTHEQALTQEGLYLLCLCDAWRKKIGYRGKSGPRQAGSLPLTALQGSGAEKRGRDTTQGCLVG